MLSCCKFSCKYKRISKKKNLSKPIKIDMYVSKYQIRNIVIVLFYQKEQSYDTIDTMLKVER